MRTLPVLLWLLLAVAARSQNPVAESDFTDLGTVVSEAYARISGPAGVLDTAAVRALFLPEATFTFRRKFKDFENTYPQAVTLNLREYLAMAAENHAHRAFYEEELGRRVQRFHGLAVVWSPYQILLGPEKKLYKRGINVFVLINSNGRWFISHTAWDTESEGHPLPPEDLFPQR